MAHAHTMHSSRWRRVGYGIIFAMQAAMGGTGLWMLGAHNWKHASVSFLAVLVSLLPPVVNHMRHATVLPVGFSVAYVGFTFLSFFMGEVFGVYGSFVLWDKIMHFISGILLVAAAVWFIGRYAVKTDRWVGLFGAFCFSLAASVIWEIVEFLSDIWLGTYSQGASLTDTMQDIVANAAASLLTILIIMWRRH